MGITQIVEWQPYMQLALAEAQLANAKGEVPVGAVLVDAAGNVIAKGHNQPISAIDPSAHAEITVLRQAAKALNNYRLVDTTLVVTLEPCLMCLGALIYSRVARVVYGATQWAPGERDAVMALSVVNHDMAFVDNVMAQDCQTLLKQFFQQKRNPHHGNQSKTESLKPLADCCQTNLID